jgi:ectoine hydroxylase-related dioxygenase (phytanoyl-CoA dioxygenase family)
MQPALRPASPRLHPLNTSFAWQTYRGTLRMLTAEQRRAYDEFGFFVFDRVFDEGTLDAITAEIDRFEAQAEAALRRMEGGRGFIARADEITFTSHMVKKSPLLREFCCSPFFQDLVHDLIGPDVRLYWEQAVYKKPHTPDPFPWHQDNGYTYVEPQQYITCWVALSDAYESNGGLWLQPGGHLLGTLQHDLTDLGYACYHSMAEDAIPVPIARGGLAIFSSITPHYTGPNHTGQTRKAYILQYVPEGAEIVIVDSVGRQERRRANEPDRQFPILSRGRPPV